MGWLDRLFGGRDAPKETSKEALKDRLNLVLAYDRAKIAPGKVEALRKDLMEVVHRYFPEEEGNDALLEVEQRGDTVVLVANIPIKN